MENIYVPSEKVYPFLKRNWQSFLGITQSSLNRYENGQSTPTVELFCKYAAFFDVSMDYIFARCAEPQGKLYHYQLKVWKNAANRMKDSVLRIFSGTTDE